MAKLKEVEKEAVVEAKSFFAKATATISDMLKVVWPQWIKAETAWKAWTWTKRSIAIGVLVAVGFLAWKFSIDITRLTFGSYRAASVYGHDQGVTKSDISAALGAVPSFKNLDDLQSEVNELKANLEAANGKLDKLSKANDPKLATGSLQKKPKDPAKPKATKDSVKAIDKPKSFDITDWSTWKF